MLLYLNIVCNSYYLFSIHFWLCQKQKNTIKYSIFTLSFACLKPIEVPKSPSLPISKSPHLQASPSPSLPISKSPHLKPPHLPESAVEGQNRQPTTDNRKPKTDNRQQTTYKQKRTQKHSSNLRLFIFEECFWVLLYLKSGTVCPTWGHPKDAVSPERHYHDLRLALRQRKTLKNLK